MGFGFRRGAMVDGDGVTVVTWGAGTGSGGVCGRR